jgi:hypothetical protein
MTVKLSINNIKDTAFLKSTNGYSSGLGGLATGN